MIEAAILAVVAVFIAILFYKQANESFQILQLDADRLKELPTLYADHSPIVVKGATLPPLGTEAELRRRPAVLAALAAPSTPLSVALTRPGFRYSPVTTAFLARESGLDTWFPSISLTPCCPPLTRNGYTFRKQAYGLPVEGCLRQPPSRLS